MKILALDSSGLVASVAVLEDDTMVAEYTVNYKKTHSQTLLPMLDEVKRMTDLDLESIDALAVAAGPGSFTGLRIGAATVKGLAMALDKPIISVPTLEGLAYNMMGYPGYICPMMDARRNQVYSGIYQFEDGGFHEVVSGRACPVEEMITACNQMNGTVIFLGDGVPVYQEKIRDLCTADWKMAPSHMNRQRAGAVAERAAVLFREGRLESAEDHAPIYFRKSQAERELALKQQTAGKEV